MDQAIIDHYLAFSEYTYPGLYEDLLKTTLPHDVRAIGLLVRQQFIHRTTLAAGNTGSNSDQKYGDMTQVPWHRQPEDDVFPTAPAMLAELYRRDNRGFVADRKPADKLVLTCRFVAILMATILKSKGIPARVRSGFAPYFGPPGSKSCDHWITQYWQDGRWVTIDVDGSLHSLPFDPYDIPPNTFDFAADAWIKARTGTVPADHFWNAAPNEGLVVVAWELFYDFHCLMNNEVIYLHIPPSVRLHEFSQRTESDLKDIDVLAGLMQDPDKNFILLKEVWNSNRTYRLLKGGLL